VISDHIYQHLHCLLVFFLGFLLFILCITINHCVYSCSFVFFLFCFILFLSMIVFALCSWSLDFLRVWFVCTMLDSSHLVLHLVCFLITFRLIFVTTCSHFDMLLMFGYIFFLSCLLFIWFFIVVGSLSYGLILMIFYHLLDLDLLCEYMRHYFARNISNLILIPQPHAISLSQMGNDILVLIFY
jgi:hypothetical protein